MIVRRIISSQTRPLRHTVLWPHILKEEDCVIDIDEREDAIHLGTFLNDELVAVGSFFKMSSPKLSFERQYRLRAMATHPDVRGTGAGKLLVQTGIQLLRDLRCDVLWCDARIKAVGFYASIGFHRLEEIYQVPQIGPHQFMWFEL